MSRNGSFPSPVIVLLVLVGTFGPGFERMLGGAATGLQEPSRTWPTHLENTTRFELPGDILVRQHQQIEDYFLKRIEASAAVRDKVWKPDFSSEASYVASLRGHRKRLVEMLGLIAVEPQELKSRCLVAEGKVRVEEVRVSIDQGFDVRALVFFPESAVPAPAVIAIPSENLTRESFAGIAAGEEPKDWLLSLLRRGVAVATPVMVERSLDHELSQLSWRARMTRRQLLHRVGFVVGRTMVGLEVQQVMALRTFLASVKEIAAKRVAVLGVEQGGMTAFYAAAADEAFAGAVVIDYFQKREDCWKEPVDRMLYGQLNSFGDAEVAALIAPRRLVALSQLSGPVNLKSADLEAKRARRFYGGLGLAERLEVAPAEISVEWGWIEQGNYFVASGPAPLGGQRILPYFGISFRTLSEKED